ncbi:MAG: DUF4159 domain-containing protein [Sneathiellales bacterium]|nr:DUF4159 domain-containing protein [Sneathiellales bacterium]
MTGFLTGLSFTTPWILLALLTLPLLWWLLKLTPPSPKKISFPALRFLLEIEDKEKSSDAIPLWLLLLRLLLAALVITALAGPVLNKSKIGFTDGPAVILVDNGWTSTQDWPKKEKLVSNLISKFKEADRLVYVIPLAFSEEKIKSAFRPLTPQEMDSALPFLTPLSLAPDRSHLNRLLPEFEKLKSPEFFWISDGVSINANDAEIKAAFDRLAKLGPVTIYSGETETAPHLLLAPIVKTNSLELTVKRVSIQGASTGVIFGRNKSGKILFQEAYTFSESELATNTRVSLPSAIRNDLSLLQIKSARSAGSVFLMDDRWKRKSVGLVASSQQADTPSLLSEQHYLQKAFLPFYDIVQDDLENLVKQSPSFIALGDVAALSARQSSEVEKWVTNGGILIRFAGPKLSNSQSSLLPVTLRQGNRSLDGAMSWGKPASMGPMPENSPFANLQIDPDIKVFRQVLANPSTDLNEKTWALLEDGTPLVTSEQRGNGRLILFHTSATTAWSDLVLSGLFVEMLREISFLGSFSAQSQLSEQTFPALDLLNGLGEFSGSAHTHSLSAMPTPLSLPVDRPYPAGIYGNSIFRYAHNIGDGVKSYSNLSLATYSGQKSGLEEAEEISLKAPVIIGALLLLLIDILATLYLQGRLTGKVLFAQKALLFGLLFTSIFAASTKDLSAEESLNRLLEATLDTRLGYILTQNPAVDEMSKAGLKGISEKLRQRTSIEAATPLPIDIEKNELLFFPLIYWPMTSSFPGLSDKAVTKINKYLKNGGTILFDTRNQISPSVFASAEGQRLSQILDRLDIQRLTQVPPDHVITRAFYLMQAFPGRYQAGEVWIENTENAHGNDGVASVIIGSHDWAAAWATDNAGRPIAAVIPGGNRQREMSYRFGVNLVMYTLAGNYKADQVHVPAILERLGQ